MNHKSVLIILTMLMLLDHGFTKKLDPDYNFADYVLQFNKTYDDPE